MAKQTSRTISREENNIIYVEPNYEYSTEMYGTNGLNTYEFIPPTEDYSIYVNLKVETRGRTIRTNATNDKNELVLSWETDMSGRTTTNLMEGTRIHVGNKGNYINSLTTNYTDIFIGDWKKKPRATIEMFGINSIDISYNSYMVPEVTIEFTDIRGAAVFGPKEAYETALNDAGVAAKDGNVDVANTFFQCFFTFPYPKFTLLIKGFYGQPVSYELSCADFRARFNSSSGNFDCTAKFVGYHFSFLADVMFNILVAAPYSDYIGADYWNDQDFRVVGPTGELNVRMPKLADVTHQLQYVERIVERMMQTEPEVQEALVAEASQYNSQYVLSAYYRYLDSITSRIEQRFIGQSSERGNLKLYFEELNSQGYPTTFILFTDSSNNEYLASYLNHFNEIRAAYETLRLTIDEYNNSNPPMKVEELESTDEDENEGDGEFMDVFSLVIKELPNENEKAYVEWESCDRAIPNSLYDEINENVAIGNGIEGTNPYLEFSHGYVFKSKVADSINKILNANSNAEEDSKKDLIKKKRIYLAEALGWMPSVENMTRIVMAHFQTLAYMIFKTGYDIASENPRRTMASLGVVDADDLSDVPESQKNTYVPPFPKVTKKTTHQGDTVREETWVGEYRGVGFLEKELVHGLINGVSMVAEKLNASGETEPLEEYDKPSLVQTTSTGATSTVMPFPICTLDLIAEENIYLDGGHDKNDVSSVLGLVALRGINAISVSTRIFNPILFSSTDVYELLGKLEWVNYLALNGGSISGELNKKLYAVKQNPDSIINMLKGEESDVIKKPLSGKWPWEIDESTTSIINDNTFNLFRKKYTVTLGLGSYEKENTIFPYESLGWNRNNSDVYDGNVGLNSESYSNSNEQVSKKNIFIFDTNINRFKEISDNQFGAVNSSNAPNGTTDLKTSLDSKAFFDSDEYRKKCLRLEGEYLKLKIVFILDHADKILPTKNSGMLPTSAAEAASLGPFIIGGGYNMNYMKNHAPGKGTQVGDWYYDDGKTKVVRKVGPNGEEDAFPFYIKNLNDYEMTLVEFPGLENDASIMIFDGDPATSVFCQRLYYMQKSDYAKALLFLCSLGYIYDYNSIAENYFNSSYPNIFIIPLPALMFFGALLWYEYDEDAELVNLKLDIYKSSLEVLIALSDDVKERLENIFKDWVRVGVDGNTSLKPFNKFSKGLELTIKEGSTNITSLSQFFKLLDEPEDRQNWISGAGYTYCLDLLADTFTDDFFRNYIAIDEDHYGDYDKGTKGFRVGNRDGAPSIIDAVSFALAGCVCVKTTEFFDNPSEYIYDVSIITKLKSFFKGFLNDITDSDEETSVELISRAAEPSNTTDDIKVGVYRYCKLLYDKWLGGLSMEEFEDNWTMPRFFERSDKYFHFIDGYYNLANNFPIGLGNFADSVIGCFSTDSQYHLLSFLSNMYSHNKFNFLCIQNFIDLSDPNNMKEMFDLVPYTHKWNIKENPNFIVMYPYEASSHLDIEDGQYEGDSFMINDTFNKHKWPEPLKSRNAGVTRGYRVPAFGVSFGRMYQSYFNNIEVGMDNPVVTEQSIKAQYQIACNEVGQIKNDGTSRAYTYGQDLYAIYSNNSYTCNVTMMGCAWVQPLMYFVLNNVPMFRGTYLIENVTHHIEPGNMTTKFMGVRMANVANRIVDEMWVYSYPLQDGDGSNSNPNTINDAKNRLADIDNDCPYKIYPLTEGDAITYGGNYGEPSYASYLTKNFGELKGYSIPDTYKNEPIYWRNRNFLDSITAALCAESDGTQIGVMLVTATMYNRVKARKGSLELLANISQYSVWVNGTAEKKYNNRPSNWEQIKEIASAIFTSGACSCMVGKSFVISNDWDLGRNENNDLFYLQTGKEYHLTPEQVSQMIIYGFKEEWDGTYTVNGRVPPNHIRDKVCKLLAVLGTTRPQAVCSEPSTSPLSKVTGNNRVVETTKIEENGDKHIEDVAVNFFSALDRTCASTASNIKLATDPNKSSGNTIWIEPSVKTITNFSKVFDIIVNGYGSKVEEVRWVVAKGQDLKSEPIAYLVTVKDGATVTKVHVVYENNLNNRLNLPISEDTSGNTVNINFCKTLRKKYNPKNIPNTTDNNNAAIIENAKHMLRSDVDSTIDDEGATIIITSDFYKMKDCGTVLTENGVYQTDYTVSSNADLIGFSGEVKNEKMKKVLRFINDYCRRHKYDIDSYWYNVKGVTGGRFNQVTGGMCTYSVSTWYAYSDVENIESGERPREYSAHDLHFWSSPATSTFNEIKSQMNRYGFKLVWHGTIAESKELDKNPAKYYRPGDVSTQHYYKTNGVASSHACMWTGHDWRSDFYQGGQMVAGKKYTDRQGKYSMCIWRHPDYQEDGMTVEEVT